MLQAINLGIRRGTKLLFDNTSFQIHPTHKVGLTGANGTGKSSFFSLILDQLHADTGDCVYPANWVVAHVAQELAHNQQTALDFVLDGDVELRQIQQAINRAENDNDGILLATLHTQLDNINGYSANSRASQLLSGLGFSNSDESRTTDTFSGGWQMRLNLARALMCRSDLLLLDEPTNHLDLDTIIWLETWLSAYRGTLLLISHDRDFLNNICTHIAHLEQQSIQLYTGNYSAFERIRAERLANQQSQYIKQQRDIAHIESYITRFRAQATKARQAQSRLRALERMQTIAPAHVDSPFHFSLFEPEKIPNSLLHMERVEAGYGDNCILRDIDFQLLPGDRIGLLGPNGAGKSTFIKVLADQLEINKGEYHLAKETRIGYFAQHQLEQLHDEHSPIEHLQQIDRNAREADLRNYLGRFGFSNDMALSKIQNFSGGEKSRLVLAIVIYQKPNLLLLDEPTNHLDLEMREALAEALQDFSGAMVIVSHDRHLLNATCDRLLLVNQRSVEDFPLSLDEYPGWLTEHNLSRMDNSQEPDNKAIDHPVKDISNKERKRLEAEQRKKTLPLRKKIKKLEDDMQKISDKQSDINQQLADNTVYSDDNKQKLKVLLLEKAELERLHASAETDWMDASEELEKL
ncbi:MAG TPA: ATP-binding cassette domain-containing protein [Gammaproteobacteria bacterium]|nr:ATP-binding cassette domain-containing protein [Gammaproteobacteria bacterium]